MEPLLYTRAPHFDTRVDTEIVNESPLPGRNLRCATESYPLNLKID